MASPVHMAGLILVGAPVVFGLGASPVVCVILWGLGVPKPAIGIATWAIGSIKTHPPGGADTGENWDRFMYSLGAGFLSAGVLFLAAVLH